MSEKTEKPSKNALGDPRRGKKSKKGPRRLERRFVAQSAHNPWLVRILGVVGATTLGAGAYAYFYAESFKKAAEAARASASAGAAAGVANANANVPAEALRMEALPLYMIAFAAIVIGITIWLGTSSEAPLRVGDPGIAMDRGEVRRMPWWGISQISWEPGNLALVISGKDEASTPWTFKVPLKAHREAVGWILKESLDRIPKVVDIKDNIIDELPGAGTHAGMKVDLEPLQVVGKKDAVTGKLISYEPDARVCVRCERVYFKTSVPKKCKCGASLVELRTASVGEEQDEESENDEDEESGHDHVHDHDHDGNDAKAKASETT
jgi:hypothetical protein